MLFWFPALPLETEQREGRVWDKYEDSIIELAVHSLLGIDLANTAQ